LDRKEAIDLVKELGLRELIKPSFVILHRAEPDKYMVKMKGDCDWKEIESFLTGRGYTFEQLNDYLIISKP
jgi:hypothetical protein